MNEKSNRHKRFWRYVPLILWIGVIFYASSNQGSMTNTSRFIGPLLKFLFPEAGEELLTVYHGYIRKLAHLTEYAILAFWSWRSFYFSPTKFLQRFWYLWAFFIVLVISVLDETNQSFNNNRTGSAWDVLLDCFGGAIMIFLLYIFNYFFKRTAKDP